MESISGTLTRRVHGALKHSLPWPVRHFLRASWRRLEDRVPYLYEGYAIPRPLMRLTGAAPGTWPALSRKHREVYERFCPLRPDDFVVEIGCGVGKDAMQIAKLLSGRGRYLGVDILRDSIEWCQKNITPRHPHCEFFWYDPERGRTIDTRLPVEGGAVNRVVLQSVFTHMFEPDIVHYLREFRRVLAPGGLVLATFYLVDEATRAHARQNLRPLTFTFPYGEDCYIQSLASPDAAVGYTEKGVGRMLAAAGLELAQPIERASWSGLHRSPYGQEIALLKVTGPV